MREEIKLLEQNKNQPTDNSGAQDETGNEKEVTLPPPVPVQSISPNTEHDLKDQEHKPNVNHSGPEDPEPKSDEPAVDEDNVQQMVEDHSVDPEPILNQSLSAGQVAEDNLKKFCDNEDDITKPDEELNSEPSLNCVDDPDEVKPKKEDSVLEIVSATDKSKSSTQESIESDETTIEVQSSNSSPDSVPDAIDDTEPNVSTDRLGEGNQEKIITSACY